MSDAILHDTTEFTPLRKAEFDQWLEESCLEDVKPDLGNLANFLKKRPKQLEHFEKIASERKETQPMSKNTTVEFGGNELNIEEIPNSNSESTGSYLRHSSHMTPNFLVDHHESV